MKVILRLMPCLLIVKGVKSGDLFACHFWHKTVANIQTSHLQYTGRGTRGKG